MNILIYVFGDDCQKKVKVLKLILMFEHYKFLAWTVHINDLYRTTSICLNMIDNDTSIPSDQKNR